MGSNLMDINEVSRILRITRWTILRLVMQKKFPAGIKIEGSRRWRMFEINAWIENFRGVL